jgi:hypothetical protein
MAAAYPVFGSKPSYISFRRLTLLRKLNLALCLSLGLAALVIGHCRVSLAQGDADLEMQI